MIYILELNSKEIASTGKEERLGSHIIDVLTKHTESRFTITRFEEAEETVIIMEKLAA